jgi:hypothetical protein
MTSQWQKISDNVYKLVNETGVIGWVQIMPRSRRWTYVACVLADHRVIGSADNRVAAMRAVEREIGEIQ